MKKSELTISKKRYEYLGGLGHLRGMNHWNVTTPTGKKYHIRTTIKMHGFNGRTDIFKGHYGEKDNLTPEEKYITEAEGFHSAIRYILSENTTS